MNNLAELPSRDVLIARMLGSMLSPISSFARVIQAIADKMGGAPEETTTEAVEAAE